MRMGDNGYVFAFIGDEQASPHFMRYSGLTGVCASASRGRMVVWLSVLRKSKLKRGFLFSSRSWHKCHVIQRICEKSQ